PSVAAIGLPELGQWTPAAPALPGTAGAAGSGTAAMDRHATGRQVNALPEDSGTPRVTPSGTPAHPAAQAVTLEDLAAVAGVPVPEPGEQLTGRQLDVVLRCLRYSDDPPMSYRQARDAFRRAGFTGSEERIRHAWGALLTNENGEGEECEEDAAA
ncbi:hypothetical protein AB0K09_19030, partial [Streptomyces sp. NPDC049577]